MLDPSITKSDKLSGKVLGYPGKLPPVLNQINIEVHLLERVVGSEEELEVKPLASGETLMLNAGTSTTVGIVATGKKGLYNINLKMSVCARKESRITIARRYGTRWRLIGYGILQ